MIRLRISSRSCDTGGKKTVLNISLGVRSGHLVGQRYQRPVFRDFASDPAYEQMLSEVVAATDNTNRLRLVQINLERFSSYMRVSC